MYQAPMQDNNSPQHENPKHPANVARKAALARVRANYLPKIVPHEMRPATPMQMARAQEYNREHPNTTFFTPSQSREANRMARRNNPLGVLGDAIEHRVGLRGVGKGIATTFNPTTRTGLVNALSMFAGGPKGDASPMMGKLGMPGQFRDYGGAGVNPLERGVALEGSHGAGGGAGIRGLTRRAQGVGGYRRANPLDVIEGKHAANSNLRETADMIKHYSNRQGFRGNIRKAAGDRTDTLMALDEIMGSRTIPYSPPEANRLDASPESIPATGRGLDNFVKYLSHYMNRGHGFDAASKKAMHDLLFGGDLFQFPGSGPIPRKP